MPSLSEHHQQILAVHGQFIRQLVEAALAPDRKQDVELLLENARENGWEHLVAALRRILAGSREESVLAGLDAEDRVIAGAVLRGLQDPSTLPSPALHPEPALAAPGLAAMIRAAAAGNVQALQLIADMAEQMRGAGGDMARVAGVIRPLINGERDAGKLVNGMSAQAERLVLDLLRELGGHSVH